MNIYVGNLPYGLDRDELRATFAAFGEVSSARIVTDRETNKSKGFGFVEMPNDAEARNAIAELNGKEIVRGAASAATARAATAGNCFDCLQEGIPVDGIPSFFLSSKIAQLRE